MLIGVDAGADLSLRDEVGDGGDEGELPGSNCWGCLHIRPIAPTGAVPTRSGHVSQLDPCATTAGVSGPG